MLLVAVVAVGLAIKTNRDRQEAATRETYDSQKELVARVIESFGKRLEKDGRKIEDRSRIVGGSGEWRATIAMLCQNRDGRWQACHVEVMGSVTNDSAGMPTWRRVLPLRISSRGSPLNQQFIAALIAALDEQGWAFTRDTNLHDSLLHIF
ncbi:hypothetical protein C5Y97_09170 [Blastopirellula marina]|uniref:Uncharacterized protein n=2 Tax=Blastopirellula marina TaxID=124 RepID=A0A2S8G1P3_9BACT|nr:hypothetical protein C5Y98_09165 [Blastopirellula marina]PTL44886.1 hypothetical protein C5Y97_09170 [Blastopirellula marina]